MTTRSLHLSALGRKKEPGPLCRSGFTLLELCMVLVLVALLAGLSMPQINAAFAEQALRADAGQFSVMVKTGMMKSAEQNRAYELDVAGGKVSLQPVPTAPTATAEAKPPTTLTDDDVLTPDPVPPLENVTINLKLANQLALPDAISQGQWEAPPASLRWTFVPAGLCPLPRVRFSRGSAWIEMSFNALTGDVEDEGSYVP